MPPRQVLRTAVARARIPFRSGQDEDGQSSFSNVWLLPIPAQFKVIGRCISRMPRPFFSLGANYAASRFLARYGGVAGSSVFFHLLTGDHHDFAARAAVWRNRRSWCRYCSRYKGSLGPWQISRDRGVGWAELGLRHRGPCRGQGSS